VTLPGEFLPYQSVQVSARVNGYVEKVDVDRGSVVKKGHLLAVLSAPEMDAQLAEAESKVQSTDSQRVEAEARLISAKSTHDRLKTASATPGAVAGNELVLAENAVAAAQALVRTQESAKRAAQAAVDAIRDLKNYLRVTAPFDGIITERYVHPGALVGPGANSAGPLLKLEQISRLRLVVAVPESDVGAVRTGTHVTFTVPAFPGETFTGSIARIPRSMDPKTRTMAVELDVFNSKGRLAPGMYPEVSWPVNRGRASLLVPPSSIVTTTERTFVIRVENGRAGWVNVRRGSPAGDLVEVYGDLREGDQIVRRATDEIRNGSPVQVKPT
jgi:RND family efflux transporter MFP subunit